MDLKKNKNGFFQSSSDIGYFFNGKKDGYWKHLYDDGNLKCCGVYCDDKKTGLWVYYDEKGTITERGYYLNGLKNGYWENCGKKLSYYKDKKIPFPKILIDEYKFDENYLKSLHGKELLNLYFNLQYNILCLELELIKEIEIIEEISGNKHWGRYRPDDFIDLDDEIKNKVKEEINFRIEELEEEIDATVDVNQRNYLREEITELKERKKNIQLEIDDAYEKSYDDYYDEVMRLLDNGIWTHKRTIEEQNKLFKEKMEIFKNKI